MSNTTQYVQCQFARENEDGSRSVTTSWIPTRVKHQDKNGLAKVRVGMTIDLKDEEGNWDHDWIVEVMGTDIRNDAPDVRKMIRGHRKNSGDSMPRRKGS